MLIAADSKITAEMAAKIIGVTSRTVETYIAKLKEAKILERQGSDKEGSWNIIRD